MDRTELEAKIRDLKQTLLDSDYKIIKCYEASLLNQPMPYDYVTLIAERTAWRQEIASIEVLL